MKIQTVSRKYQKSVRPAYPNAAGRDYYIRKALDIVTAILSGMGLFASIVFLAAIT